ncbi:MAG TPA: ribbon-helix-helix protein, CopG family [Egibacteraceae bacterium]|nr:ribbon-helix-helix protein, CopG family [Actinomycetota bacterium]HWB72922.1 ribbon-helix-helix protein, CopG family [Egibacteraceae bacterium]
MTSYQRTQVYLDPRDHRRLRRLAAERGVSMTTLVRDAIGRYLADEQPQPPNVLDDFHDEPIFASIPRGPEGLVARLNALRELGPPPHFDESTLNPEDRQIGDYLYEEYLRHVAEWEKHRRDDRT